MNLGNKSSLNLHALWRDRAGLVVTTETLLVATVFTIGVLVGLTSLRDALVSELSDIGGGVQDLSQSYSLTGASGHSSSTAGMDFLDALDHCDSPDDANGAADNCVVLDAAPLNEESGGIIIIR